MALSNIFEHARRTPDKIAVVHNGLACSYAYLARYIAACRDYFGQHDLRAGAVAVIDIRGLLDAWACLLALRSLGLVTVQARRAADPAAFGVGDIGCVVTAAAENPPPAPADGPGRTIRLPADLRLAATHGPVPRLAETGILPGGHILITSGTTGEAKLVLRDPIAEVPMLQWYADDINGIAQRSVAYICHFGMWTAGGYRWPLAVWTKGATLIVHQGADLHAPLMRRDVTLLFTTPAVLTVLLGAAAKLALRNDAMRLMTTGGAIGQAMLADAQRLLTPQVYSVLGSTEGLPIAVTRLERPDDLRWHRIHPTREVQVVDAAGRTLGPGEEGLLRIRMMDRPQAYLGNPEATREHFRDGWFYSGDLAEFDRDGRLALRGRASDVINLLGAKLAAEPIETAVQDRLGVESVCLLGIPDAAGEDRIYAAVEARHGLDPAKLLAALTAERRGFATVPVQVVFVERLPRNHMGKIERLELKRQILAAATAAG